MIDFSAARWDETVRNYTDFWQRQLNRPMLAIKRGKEAGEDKRGTPPDAPYLSQANCHLNLPASKWVDAYDYALRGQVFLGDAFPSICLDSFGPGIAAAFMGAQLDNSSGGVWFHPAKQVPISELTFTYNPNNEWYVKIQELMTEATRRWQGEVVVGMPDLGGVMDILSTFLPGEELLIALYDEPEEVLRCCKEIQALWFRYYDELAAITAPTARGYSNWAELFVPTREASGYIYQCDFAYMIGPDMFREFVLDDLKADFARTTHNAYHLDGTGQLPHLDMLLACENLQLIQWIPGVGSAHETAWGDVYKRILRAGKHLQINNCSRQNMRGLFAEIGNDMGAHANAHFRCWENMTLAETQAFIDEMQHWYEK